MARALRTNVVGTIAACAMSLSTAGALPLLASDELSCCCEHHADDCRCPACNHARELASGQPMLETCAPHPAIAIPLMHEVVLVTVGTQLPSAPASSRVEMAPLPPPPDPVSEVPTPPPLARS
jgi:hypothetical protein